MTTARDGTVGWRRVGTCIVPCDVALCGGVCCKAGDMCGMDNNCFTPECAKDTDCPGSKVCHHGHCRNQCWKDSECNKGDVCTDGACMTPEPPATTTPPTTTPPATSLPSTGIGGSSASGTTWLGAAAIGGAAAFLAGKKLRQGTTDAE